MSSTKSVSKKIVLLGSFCVGKTSLISRFIYKKFPIIYQTTLGVRIDKKTIDVNDYTVSMIIWDIGGEQTQLKVPDSYYLGSAGAIYVFDLTRPNHFPQVKKDLEFIKSKLPDIPILVIGNKKDLLKEKELDELKESLEFTPYLFTSAKTGENVESIFEEMGKRVL